MRPSRLAAGLLTGAALLLATSALAAAPSLTEQITAMAAPAQASNSVRMLLLLTALSMAPALLLMTTSFTRVVVVLSFVRQAIGTQAMPPNQVVIGLALFLTLFIMTPTWTAVNERALTPYTRGAISGDQAIEAALQPMREFMLAQTNENDLGLMLDIAKVEAATAEQVPTTALIPAFMISELKKAFTIGFLLYLPFLVIDLVVASFLMSMGMMMLPPPLVSLPFKLLLFVLADGWHLLVGSLVQSFH